MSVELKMEWVWSDIVMIANCNVLVVKSARELIIVYIIFWAKVQEGTH